MLGLPTTTPFIERRRAQADNGILRDEDAPPPIGEWYPMKKNPAPVLLDRLTHALERQGVKLRRQQLLETAAYAFACRSSDEFSAALKAGQLVAPDVEPIGRITLPNGTSILIVNDPLASSPYGIDESFVEHVVQGQRRERIGVTPYGNLVDLLSLVGADIETLKTKDAGTESVKMDRCIASIKEAIRAIDGYTAEDDECDDVGECELALARALDAAREGRIGSVYIEISDALESLALVRNDDAERHVEWTRTTMRRAMTEVPASTDQHARQDRDPTDSGLRPFLMMALEQIDQEIENRSHGMDDSHSSELSRISDMCHAAARGMAPEPFGDDDAEAIRISRKDLGILLDAARTQAEDVASGVDEGLYDAEDNEGADELERAISDVETRLLMPVVRPVTSQRSDRNEGTPIYVARMVHKHGSDIRVAASQRSLDAQIAEFCRENWDEISEMEGVPSHPEGMTDLEIGTMYYDRISEITDDFVEETTFTIPTSDLIASTTIRRDRAGTETNQAASDAHLPDPDRLVTITGTDGDVSFGIDAATMAGLKLPFHREGSSEHPLSEKEQEFSSPWVKLNTHLDHPVTLGATVLHRGRKWLAPSVHFGWDPLQEDFVDDARAASQRMDTYISHVGPFVEALGGSIHREMDVTDMSHELTILLPFEIAYESESVEDWKTALAYLLSTEREKSARDSVTCEFTAQKDFGRSVHSVEPAGDTVWDGTFDALRWGAQDAIAILTDEKDADEYARSPMAPQWVRDWTEKHPFEVDPIGLREALRIVL